MLYNITRRIKVSLAEVLVFQTAEQQKNHSKLLFLRDQARAVLPVRLTKVFMINAIVNAQSPSLSACPEHYADSMELL